MPKQKQINKIIGKINQEGLTVVPVRMYFNHKGIAKVQIDIAKGKKQHDKRHTKTMRDYVVKVGDEINLMDAINQIHEIHKNITI